MPKDSDGRLRNSIYQQQTRSGRQLTRGRLLLYRALVPVGLALIRLVWSWGRVRVIGREHIEQTLARVPAFIPVYWHQHQLHCVRELLALRGRGLKLGFLISPSVDGEIGAMLVRRIGAEAIRGSSSHTGARALRDYYQALIAEAISPAITPDGPRGPPWKFKPGAILLSQLARRPIIPMAFAASRAWKVQWDRFVIPMPGARVVVAVGEPISIEKGVDAARLGELQAEMEGRLQALYALARAELRAVDGGGAPPP